MAVSRSCTACRNLQENAPEFVVNGVTESVANSLKNNTGLNPSSGNNDCTDLNDANDCLIGNMEDEVDAHEVCDWKPFMVDFIHNLWTVLKSIISAICGLWSHVEKTECMTQALYNGQQFQVGEESTDGSYVVAGKGVSFLGTGTESGKSQITLRYIAGGICQVGGTIIPYIKNFTDTGKCVNFDNGSAERTSTSRKGNEYLTNTYGETHDADTGISATMRMTRVMVNGGELLYEIRILKSQYPMIKQLFGGNGFQTGGGEYHVCFYVFTTGQFAYGQHGNCDTTTGAKRNNDFDDGHLVPDGWIYVQCRMISITRMIGSPDGGGDIHKYTPRGYIGIRLNSDNVDCSGSIDPSPEPSPDPDPSPSTYVVTGTAVTRIEGTSTLSTTGGTVSPASQSVSSGASATVAAATATDYTFRGWGASKDATTYLSTSATYTLTPTGNITLYAIFEYTGSGPDPEPEVDTYTLTLGTVTDGIESNVGGTVSGAGEYTYGALADIVASPNTGYTFIGWTNAVGGSIISTSNPTYLSIVEDRTLYANFSSTVSESHRIIVSATPSGSGIATGGGTFNNGDTVTLTATPAPGYKFLNWASPQPMSASNPLTFTVDSSFPSVKTYYARFVAE